MSKEKKPLVEGLSLAQLRQKFQRKPKPIRGEIWSTKRLEMDKARLQIPAMFDILSTEEVFDLIVKAFYSKGLKPKDFVVLAKRLERKIELETKKKEERRKQAQKQLALQKTPFNVIGHLATSQASESTLNPKLLQRFDTQTLKRVRNRFRDGDVPDFLHVYSNEFTHRVIAWLTEEIQCREPQKEETETSSLLRRTINIFRGH